MPHPISALIRWLDHQGAVTFFAAVLLLLVTCVPSQSQVPVVLAPVPQLQFFDQTGTPLAFGCVFTYEVGSLTPLATYTDYTGVTLNQNPVILSAGGSANIWLQAGLAYTFRVASAGGTNCAEGSTLYTVNGIGGGSTTETTIVPFSPTPVFIVSSQTQLFEITLTGNASAQPLTFVGVTPPSIIFFQITQDSVGGHSFSWPANTIGGCMVGGAANQTSVQEFVYNGTDAEAVGPCVVGQNGSSGPVISVGNIYDYGLTTGAQPVCSDNFLLTSSCSTTLSITVNGQTIAPGGSGNVNVGAATHSLALNEGNGNAITGLSLGNNQLAVGQTSADPVASTIPTCSGGTHLTFSGTLPLTCTADLSVQVQSTTLLSGNFSVSANTATTVLGKTVTMPSSGCPCRILGSYGIYYISGSGNANTTVWLSDGTIEWDTTENWFNGTGTNNGGSSGSAFSTATYANSAAVPISLMVETDGTGFSVQQNNPFSSQPSWMNLVVFTSN